MVRGVGLDPADPHPPPLSLLSPPSPLPYPSPHPPPPTSYSLTPPPPPPPPPQPPISHRTLLATRLGSAPAATIAPCAARAPPRHALRRTTPIAACRDRTRAPRSASRRRRRPGAAWPRTGERRIRLRSSTWRPDQAPSRSPRPALGPPTSGAVPAVGDAGRRPSAARWARRRSAHPRGLGAGPASPTAREAHSAVRATTNIRPPRTTNQTAPNYAAAANQATDPSRASPPAARLARPQPPPRDAAIKRAHMADTLDHYLTWRLYRAELDIELDFADAQLDEPSLTANAPRLEAALDALHRIEGGAVANIDEGRMVGHYWLRDPERAPDPAIALAIHASWRKIESLRRRRARRQDRRRRRAAVHRRDPRRDRRQRARAAAARGSVDPARQRARLPPARARQHRSGRHRRPARRDRDLGADADPRRLEVGLDRRDAQRHARAAGRVCAAGASSSRSEAVAITGEGSAARPSWRRARAGWRASRCGTGSAGAPACSRRSACCRPRCSGTTGAACCAGPRRWTSGAACGRRGATRPRCWRWLWHQQGQATWPSGHGHAAVQGSPVAACRATCSSS